MLRTTDYSFEGLMRLGREQKMLTADDERVLAIAAQNGDRDAADRLIGAHLRMALAEARKALNAADRDDLAHQGVIGLMEALRRYRVEQGVRFATFARHWVRSQVREYAMYNDGAVRCGKTKPEKTLYNNLPKMRRKHGIPDYRALTFEQAETIGEDLGIAADRVHAMDHRRMFRDVSCDVVHPETGETYGAQFVDDAATPEDALAERQAAAGQTCEIEAALDRLDARERAIIQARKMQETVTTLQDLSEVYGVSKERIRQLEVRALGKLRRFMTAEPDSTDHMLSVCPSGSAAASSATASQ